MEVANLYSTTYPLPTSMARPGRNVCLRASRHGLKPLSTPRNSGPVLTCGKLIRCDSLRIEKETPRFAAHSIQSQTTVPERSGSADRAQPKQLTVGVFSARSSNRKRFWSDSWKERPSGRPCSGARRPALGRNGGLPARRLRLYASRSLDARNSNRHVFPAMWVMHRLHNPGFVQTRGFRTQAGGEKLVDQATMRN